jgi:hypothetical protein
MPDKQKNLRLGVAGISASARLSLRTELARTLQNTATFATFTFLVLPFSRSYFALESLLTRLADVPTPACPTPHQLGDSCLVQIDPGQAAD